MKLHELKDIPNKSLTEIITDANYRGDNEYIMTYTANAGKNLNTRKIYAKTAKDAVMLVQKRLGSPKTINGQDIDFTRLDTLLVKK